MRQGIHPEYYPEAKVVCSCGNSWTTGSTVPEIHTDVCSACHPFFTGEQRIVDTAGQVDRFRRRLQYYVEHQETVSQRREKQKRKNWEGYLKQQLIALDLDDDTFQVLSNADIISIGDLLQKVENDEASLLALEGFTPDALEEINAKLETARAEILG